MKLGCDGCFVFGIKCGADSLQNGSDQWALQLMSSSKIASPIVVNIIAIIRTGLFNPPLQ